MESRSELASNGKQEEEVRQQNLKEVIAALNPEDEGERPHTSAAIYFLEKAHELELAVEVFKIAIQQAIEDISRGIDDYMQSRDFASIANTVGHWPMHVASSYVQTIHPFIKDIPDRDATRSIGIALVKIAASYRQHYGSYGSAEDYYGVIGLEEKQHQLEQERGNISIIGEVQRNQQQIERDQRDWESAIQEWQRLTANYAAPDLEEVVAKVNEKLT